MAASMVRPPQWISHRFLLEQKLSDLHKCSNLDHIRQAHAQILKYDLQCDLTVVPKLVSAYALCRRIDSAVAVFDQIEHPNTHLYNSLIRGLAHNSQQDSAFFAFFEMQRNGVAPDNFTFPFLLKVCSGQAQIETIHAQILKWGFSFDIFAPNSLIDSYAKCGSKGVISTRKLFDGMTVRDHVSWNSMIGGLIRDDQWKEARRLFGEMSDKDIITWNTMLDGLTKEGEMYEVYELFTRMPERNVLSWSTLIAGYCKKGEDTETARMLFDKMPFRNLVTWTIMISGDAEKGIAKEACSLFYQMHGLGIRPDSATLISILAACAESGLLSLGRKVHNYIDKNKIKCTTQVFNSLIVMYAKCGHIQESWKVFNAMTSKDKVSWNAMVQSLADHGHGKNALELFLRMEREGVTPDGVTFIGVLCACTHVGLVKEGQHYFARMEKDYGIKPQIEHYGCIIDLLGRGGSLMDAFELAENMPFEPSVIIWSSLLRACITHKNVCLAEVVAERLIKLNPTDSAAYTIMSNIYANTGQWDSKAKIRMQMKSFGVQKPSGVSLIEVDNMVHEFTVSDMVNPQSNKILQILHRLGNDLKRASYDPQDELVIS